MLSSTVDASTDLPEVDVTRLRSSGAVGRGRGDGEAGELLWQRNLLVKLLLLVLNPGSKEEQGGKVSSLGPVLRPVFGSSRRTFCHAHTFIRGFPSMTVAQIPPWPYAVGM